MFAKLVSGLPFSPALVSNLGFYARRLKQEQATRRLGLIMTALALVMQSFAVFSPPESANASSASDLINGGVTSLSGVLATYDNPSKDYKAIMDYAGITRAELAAMQPGTVNSRELGTGTGAWLSWGRISHFSPAQNEVKHTFGNTTVYSRPFWRFDTTSWTIKNGSSYPAFIGTSAKMGKFAIVKACGNLITTKLPVAEPPVTPPAPKDITVCRPGTGIVTIKENEKKSTDLPSDSSICKPAVKSPVAVCGQLSVKKIERTKFSLSATSVAQNGATISGYTFTIRKKDASGTIVTQKTVSRSDTQAESGVIELKDTGEYYASVTVATSAGDKTSQDCSKVLSVTAPEKCTLNPDILASDKDCQPCPANPSLWYKSPDCREQIASEKTANNLTQGNVLAAQKTANSGDRIQYTLTMYNVGKIPAAVEFKENITDAMEYATINDNGGGDLTKVGGAQYLSWGKVSLSPGEKTSRSFTVKVLDTIPLTPRGVSNPASYDCIMTNTFGNSININMNCDTPKVLEQVVEQLPSTGPTENIAFSGIVMAIVVYFYARSRQLGKEIYLIRKDFNAGTL